MSIFVIDVEFIETRYISLPVFYG